MFKKLKRDVELEIGFVHVSYVEEERRETIMVIRNPVGQRKMKKEM